eukprot:sb/3477747/
MAVEKIHVHDFGSSCDFQSAVESYKSKQVPVQDREVKKKTVHPDNGNLNLPSQITRFDSGMDDALERKRDELIKAERITFAISTSQSYKSLPSKSGVPCFLTKLGE